MARFQILPEPQEAEGARLMPCAACDVRELSVCSALRGHELDRLAPMVSRIPVAAGRTLFHEGDEAASVYNIIEGAVRLFKLLPDGRRQITGFLFSSDFIGLASRGLYAYGAEAISDVVVCRFPRMKLEALFHEMPRLENSLLDRASNELVAAQDQMLLLGRKTAVERLASFLITLGERRGATAKGDMLALPMTRTDIGDYLGLTIETVSRGITKLRKLGLIETPDIHTIALLDPDGLRKLNGGT
jgi:CRP/FNR family transcriptional regulator